jgi:uncharacterized protein
MHQAAANGHLAIVRLLLNADASLEVLNLHRYTVLRTAIVWGQLEVMQLLVSRGADVHEKLDGNTLLHVAALGSNSAIVLKLIDMGIDIEARNASGFTALHLACKSGGMLNGAIVKPLLEHGADIEARSNEEDTPLRKIWQMAFSGGRGQI